MNHGCLLSHVLAVLADNVFCCVVHFSSPGVIWRRADGYDIIRLVLDKFYNYFYFIDTSISEKNIGSILERVVTRSCLPGGSNRDVSAS